MKQIILAVAIAALAACVDGDEDATDEFDPAGRIPCTELAFDLGTEYSVLCADTGTARRALLMSLEWSESCHAMAAPPTWDEATPCYDALELLLECRADLPQECLVWENRR